MRKKAPYGDVLDGAYYSCDIDAAKPSAAFFAHIVTDLAHRRSPNPAVLPPAAYSASAPHRWLVYRRAEFHPRLDVPDERLRRATGMRHAGRSPLPADTGR